MAKTKEQPQPQVQKQQNAVERYIREVRSELSKVLWPSREQATNLTLVVLAVMVAMGLFLGLLDTVFGVLVEFLINLSV